MHVNKIIDFSAHVMVPEVEKYLAFRAPYRANNELDDRLKVMEKHQVDMQVVHLSAAHLYGLSVEGASKACKAANYYIYNELIYKKPDRFVGCAVLNLQDLDFSLNELDTILSRGFKCVTLPTHQGDIGIYDPKVFPLLEEIAKHKLPIFMHPISWEGYPRAQETELMNALGWPFETSVAIWNMIVNGTFDRIPDLKIVTHHLGAMFPFYKNRIEIRMKRLRGIEYKPLSSYVKQIYADTALDGGSIADLLVGYSFFGPRRLMFGSDWPFIDDSLSMGDNITAILSLPIPEEEKDLILYKNASELLGLKF